MQGAYKVFSSDTIYAEWANNSLKQIFISKLYKMHNAALV